jgi:hypothetical protein
MSSDSRTCSSCGERNEPDALFCGNCGRPLEQPESAAAAAPPAAVPAAAGRTTAARRRRWLLPAAGSAAVLVLAAAVIFSGVLSRGKVAQVAPPPQSPTPAVTPIVPPSVPVAIDQFEVTAVSPKRTKDGLRVALAGTLVLSGGSGGITMQILPAWRTSGTQTPLRYAPPVTLKAKNGRVAVAGIVSVPSVSSVDSILVYLTARIGDREWVSTPGSVVMAAAAPPASGPPTTPQPRAVAPTPSSTSSIPQPHTAPITASPRTAPASPPAQPSPATPAVETAEIQNVRLTSTSLIRVPPGEQVSFDLSFMLVAQERAMIEVATALRSADGGWRYQETTSFDAVKGPNVIHGLHFVSTDAAAPWTTVPVYGVVQLNGRTYPTERPVVVTIVPGTTAASPPVATPPSRPPTSAPLSPAARTPPSTLPPSDASDSNPHFISPGVGIGRVKVGMQIDDVVAILGTPKTTQGVRYYWFSSYVVGDTRHFQNGGLYVICDTTGKVLTVVAYYAPQYVTSHGLHTGVTEAAVRAAMGEPTKVVRGNLTHDLYYTAGGKTISFEINDNPKWGGYQQVTRISVFQT